MPKSVYQEFQYRLDLVLAGRKPYPWAESIGITRGTVGRMLKGEVPGPDVLGLIMRTENASITWLAEGIGAPYIVHWFATDEACRAYLDELLAFQAWTAHHLTDGGRVDVLVLHAPAAVERRSRWVHYTEIYVLAGAGPATLARLHGLPEHRATQTSTEAVAAVASGATAGTWPLLGDEGLLTHYDTMTPPAQLVAEPGAHEYSTKEPDVAISEEERKLVEIHRQLTPASRVRWREVGDAFIAADDRAAGAERDGSDGSSRDG